MKEKYRELKEEILDEQKSIEETLIRLREVRNRFAPDKKDYFIEPTMGTYLMNFYNGVENIIKRICKEYFLTMPKGESWHRELLVLSYNPPVGKIPIFSSDIVARLQPYKNFRHRFVSGYGFRLDGEKMMGLVNNIDDLWMDVRESILVFFNKLGVES